MILRKHSLRAQGRRDGNRPALGDLPQARSRGVMFDAGAGENGNPALLSAAIREQVQCRFGGVAA